MQLRIVLVLAPALASCAKLRTADTPLPQAAPPVAMAPENASPVRPAGELAPIRTADTLGQAVPDSAPLAAPVSPADSAALAKLARDSLLDAVILDRLAVAKPPEGGDSAGPASEAEAATLRTMFDIDVANWADHGRVKYYLDFFTGPARERMGIWLERMPRFEPRIRDQLMARGLPGDLAYLPLIESGYSSSAVSRSRAVGMWQFMLATGRYYGLRVDGWVDERRDLTRATDAAIRYLSDLTARFGSVYLAAAAYNGGPGRVGRGLARIDLAESDDTPVVEGPDGAPQAGDLAFFHLADTRYLRQETKDYVPKLIAAAMIAKQPERYGFPAVTPVAPPMPDSVVVNDATGLDVIARLAGTTMSELWAANLSYLRAVTPPKRRSVVRVPAGAGATTQEALDELPVEERLTGFGHHTRSGETLSRIARRYGVALAALRSANPDLRSRAPKTGEVVRIPGQARLAGWINENRRVGGEGGGATHRVRAGETLSGIGQRYRVSVAQLRAWNNLSASSIIRVGQVLRVGTGASPAVRSGSATKVHVVRAGDTLSGLARRYGVSVQSLRSANNLPSARPLLVGKRLTIPS